MNTENLISKGIRAHEKNYEYTQSQFPRSEEILEKSLKD